MAASATSLEYVQKMFLAYFGRPVAPTGQEYYAQLVDAGNVAALQDDFWNSDESQDAFGGLSTEARVNAIFQQLFGRDAAVAGLTYWTGEINSGRVSLPQAALTILNSASEADLAVFNAKLEVANAFTAELDTTAEILAYQSNTDEARDLLAGITSEEEADAAVADIENIVADVVAGGSVVSGETFTLTAGIDTKTGTSGADTFDGSLVSGVQTLGSSDNLNGGAGADTLIATLNSTATISPTLTSIENIQVVDTAGATLNLQNATGVESIVATGSARTSFNNIASKAVALEISGNNQGANFSFANAALADAADEVTVKLNGVNDTINAQINVLQAAGADTTGAETVIVNSTGSANRVAQVTSVNAAATDVLKTVKVTGDQALTINAALGTTTTTVDASGQTTAGGVTATMTAGAAKFIGGAGADAMSFTTTAGDVSVSGGAGNDSFTFGGAGQTLTNADTIDGGDGTDTIVAVSADLVGYTKLATPTITNVEAVKVSNTLGGNITLSNIAAGIRTVELAAGNDAGQDTITFESGANTVNLTGTTVIGSDGIKFAVAGNGTTDSVTINADSTTAMFNAGEPLAVDGAETITINAKKVAEVIDGITLTNTMAAAQTVNFGGGFGVTAGTIAATTGTIAAINASAMTVATTAAGLSATAGSATAMTGSGGRDALTGSSGKDTIDGGAGNDTITSGGGNDVISGGDGNDTITLNGAGTTASVDGGAGNDTITVSGNLAKTQTIGGGEGTDILVINATDVTTFNALSTAEKAALKGNITGIETLAFAANTGATLDVSTLVNTAEVTTYRFDAAQTSQVNNVASGSTLDLTTAASNFTATVKDASTATTDAITYKYTNIGDINFGTQTIANVETISVVSNDADAATDAAETHTAIIAADSVVGGLNISGDNNLVLSVTGATKLATTTVTSTGTLNLDVSASTVANTITLGSGNSTVVSGIGADSITGGIGNDSIDAGSGNDTVIGGAGNDTINGGAGSDSLSGGSGNDVFLTSAGTDTIDGGDGTDSLKVSSGVFNNISSINLSSVETLDMNSLAVTMNIAQYAGFTTISNASGGVVFADAGTIAGNVAVNSYTLANGTNTFTAATPTAGQQSVLGGTGVDTFNFTVAQVATNTTIKGGTGADVLNFTNNAAVSLGSNAISDVEKIVFNNTDTNISFTTGDSMQAANGTTTIEVDASNLTTGEFVFNASGEDDGTFGFKVLKGGTGNATITGSAGVDTILGGAGSDTIAGGGGADVIDLSSGGTDSVVLTKIAVAGSVAGAALISGFTAGGTATADNIVALDTAYAFANGATDGAVVLATGATLDAAHAANNDFTVATISTNVATHTFATYLAGTSTIAELEGAIATALGAATNANFVSTDKILVAIDDGTHTGIVFIESAGDGDAIAAAELSLVGIVQNLADATTLAAGDFLFA
ncbi:DUF4214 domain-containing protein [Thauera aromatica]|nr:DUF4214 domain-containing protein [Thauera aromatica]MCK2128069.1 DUF4214 domain-containing protein [Thauera aromatica]